MESSKDLIQLRLQYLHAKKERMYAQIKETNQEVAILIHQLAHLQPQQMVNEEMPPAQQNAMQQTLTDENLNRTNLLSQQLYPGKQIAINNFIDQPFNQVNHSSIPQVFPMMTQQNAPFVASPQDGKTHEEEAKREQSQQPCYPHQHPQVQMTGECDRLKSWKNLTAIDFSSQVETVTEYAYMCAAMCIFTCSHCKSKMRGIDSIRCAQGHLICMTCLFNQSLRTQCAAAHCNAHYTDIYFYENWDELKKKIPGLPVDIKKRHGAYRVFLDKFEIDFRRCLSYQK